MHYGGDIGNWLHNDNINKCKWEMLSFTPHTSCKGEKSWYAVGQV